MAETDLGSQVLGARADFEVDRVKDVDRVRELLRARLEYTAYALAQLEPGLVERSRTYHARGSAGSGLVVHSSGGLGQALLASGEPLAVGAILSLHPGPVRTYATFQPQHAEIMRRTFYVANTIPMLRMAVSNDTFQAAPGRTEALTGADVRRINALYSSDGGPAFYSPDHIDSELYRGVIEEGMLVAIAGTHVISRRERIAVVGNVFTHPAYRGRGFARRVTGAVTERLLDFSSDVVLTVDPGNAPAVTAYRKLGYREVCRIVESTARRHDPTGLRSSLRRMAGRWRGRRRRGALVTMREG